MPIRWKQVAKETLTGAAASGGVGFCVFTFLAISLNFNPPTALLGVLTGLVFVAGGFLVGCVVACIASVYRQAGKENGTDSPG